LNLKYKLIGGFPGMALNLMAFGALLGIMLYLLKVKGSIAAALPFIGLIALSLQRLLPAVDKIYNAVGLIRKYEPGIRIVKDALERFGSVLSAATKAEADIPDPIIFEKSIRFDAVSFCYRVPYKKALDRVSFEIGKNESVGIIGGSGAGKSRLVDVLLGLLVPSEGRVFCDNLELKTGGAEWRAFNRLVGYVPQQTFLLDTTIKENIAFGVAPERIDMAAVRTAVQTAQMQEFIESLPEKYDTCIGERGVKLSGGQRQRIGIARALYHNPQILILDEATNSLDLPTEADFLGSLRVLMGQKTLIIIAHRLSSLTLCSRLILIKDGRIVTTGSTEELRVRSPEFKQLYESGSRT
jgi:ATP-binding cassette subfamily C protein